MGYPSQDQIEKWHNDLKYWKLGIFYYNREDNRILVSKNPEWMGLTLNFANPKTYLAILGFVAFFGFVIFMVEHNAR